MHTINPEIWEFPCQHDIKVLGLSHHPLVDVVITTIAQHVENFDSTSIRTKASSSGKYLSVTATVQFSSKEQLEALYSALHAREEVTQTL